MSYKIFYFLIVSLFVSIACTRQPSIINETTRVYDEFEYPLIQIKGKTLSDFVPPFWSAADTIYEDLNRDGKTDALLLLTYSDTIDEYAYPEGVINYQLFEQRILLMLYKNYKGYILNTYCYKLLNFHGGMDRGGLVIEKDDNTIILSFEIAGNGMYHLYYTFEPEIKTGLWVLIKANEQGGNAEYSMNASYNFKNDSLYFQESHWNNDENDTTWSDYNSNHDTIIHTEKHYYLDSMEYLDFSPSSIFLDSLTNK